MFLLLGLLFLIGAFHPVVGGLLYRDDFPGLFIHPSLRNLARLRVLLLSSAWLLVSLCVHLYSFGVDHLTIVGLICLALAVVCALVAMVLGGVLHRRHRAVANG